MANTNFTMTAKYPRDQAVDKTTVYNMGGPDGGSYEAMMGKIQPAHEGSQSKSPSQDTEDSYMKKMPSNIGAGIGP